MQPNYPPPGQYPPPPPRRSSNTLVIVLVVVFGGIFLIGILAAIAIPAFMKAQKKSKRSEAELNLSAIEKGLKAYFVEQARFPTEAAGPTPATPCCDQGRSDRKCEPDMSEWMVEPWDSIYFMIDLPHYYQYSYEPSADGLNVVVRARGDLDCDGTFVEYTLLGTVVEGNPAFVVEKPARAD